MRWLGCTALLLVAVASSVRAQDPNAVDLGIDSEWDAVMMWPTVDDESAATEKAAPKKRSRKHARDKADKADKSRKTPKPSPTSPAGYDALKASWHERAPETEVVQADAALVPALVFRVVGKADPFVLFPTGKDGGFSVEQIAVASVAFGTWDSGPQVHAHLLDLIYRAVRHFDVPYVHLVSGIRRDRRASRHSHGLAADIVLPGVDDDDLAAFFRLQGFVGVGIYTRAGFVHIDVRDQSYFWLDRSPPGRRMKISPVRGEEAKAMDEAALARGEQPFVNPAGLAKALEGRAKRKRSSKKPKKPERASAGRGPEP